MNKNDLTARVAESTGLSKAEAKCVVEAFIKIVTQHLADRHTVRIAGLGTFSSKARVARTGRNPQSGQPITIPAAVVPLFRPDNKLKGTLTISGDMGKAELEALREVGLRSHVKFSSDLSDTMGTSDESEDEASFDDAFSDESGRNQSEDGLQTPPSESLNSDEIIVPVHYATNRKPGSRDSLNSWYGSDRNESLEYGEIEVSIPESHSMGKMERPGFFRLWKEKPGKHIMLRNIVEEGEDSFFVKLSERVAETSHSQAFVFVHGFNVSFDAASRRAAQMAYDLFNLENIDQHARLSVAPILFSWPSEGNKALYYHDISNADASVSLFKEFLQQVAERSGAESITIIAHSMGCKLLTAALNEVGLAMQEEDGPLINEIILAAPDIDKGVFLSAANAVKRTGVRVTLYASDRDKALLASKAINGFPRAGDARGGVVIVEGIDSIDASEVGDDILVHSYVAQTSVLKDLYYIIRSGLSPEDRFGIRAEGNPPNSYWVMRKGS